jgi:branched-chain amino acid transport system substrate-binding protein
MSVFAKAKASRSRSFKSVLGGVAVLGVSAVILSGCAAPAAEEDTAEDTTTTETREDLTLKIGTILPVTGSLAFLGPPEIAGVGLAAQQINRVFLVMASPPSSVSLPPVCRSSSSTT